MKIKDIKLIIDNYKPSEATKGILQSIPINVIAGPSSSGKNTIIKELLKTGQFFNITSFTTRLPRTNKGIPEIDGVDYHFIDEAQAIDMVKKQEFIELAIVHDVIYGTSISEFIKASKISKQVLLDIDIQGVSSYYKLTSNMKVIFLLPPSLEEIINRYFNRQLSEAKGEDLIIRLNSSIIELEEFLNKDYFYPLASLSITDTTEQALQIINSDTSPQKDPQSIKLAETLIKDIKQYLNSLKIHKS